MQDDFGHRFAEKRPGTGQVQAVDQLSRVLPPSAGTYALWFRLGQPLTLEVGRLGRASLGPGAAVYVGSAHGPGGLRARVGHHVHPGKKLHWHIDALTACVPVYAVWYTRSPHRLECRWAALLQAVPGVTIPIPGFGASDCACPAHLFAMPAAALSAAWHALVRPAVLTLWC